MARARVILLEPSKEAWFLYRYAPDGSFAGDTWHALSVWDDVPDDVDAFDHAVETARSLPSD